MSLGYALSVNNARWRVFSAIIIAFAFLIEWFAGLSLENDVLAGKTRKTGFGMFLF